MDPWELATISPPPPIKHLCMFHIALNKGHFEFSGIANDKVFFFCIKIGNEIAQRHEICTRFACRFSTFNSLNQLYLNFVDSHDFKVESLPFRTE